ncbi:YadA-like family protein [Histophilus somni]
MASGLGILAIEESEKQQLTQAVEDKKNKVSESEKALAQTTADVKSKQQALTEKTNELSQVASERPVLLMQKADLEQQLKGLGASDPRRATAQAALDKVKEALTQNDQKVTEATKTANEASEALKQAKVALADNVLKAYAAQQALATAEETLRNKEFGVDKVKDLLSGSSNIAEDNVATIKDVKALAKAGLSFEGNDGKRLHKDLSETLAIKGEENASGDKFNSNHTAAGNIKVEMAQDGKGLEVKLSDQLKNLTSVETKKDDQGRSTTLLSRGVMVQNDTTKEQAQFSENRLAFFKDGALGLNLDGKSRALKVGEKAIISINDKGEALVSDLNEFSSGMTITNKNYVDTKNNELRTQLNNTDRTLRAGIAGSNAAAGLASVSMPGKSMLAISAAGYGGENAVAIGYSRMSDNGKIMLQLQGNRNSRGKAAGSVSIGYQW